MKFKRYLISTIILGSMSLFSTSAMSTASIDCTGNNIDISLNLDADGIPNSYDATTRSGSIYLGRDKLIQHTNRTTAWKNGRYVYKLYYSQYYLTYTRVKVFRNGRTILNKKLKCEF